MGSDVNNDQHKILFLMLPNTIGFARKTGLPLHHGHVTHSLKVNKSKTDKNQLYVLFEMLISITFSFQWYIIR